MKNWNEAVQKDLQNYRQVFSKKESTMNNPQNKINTAMTWIIILVIIVLVLPSLACTDGVNDNSGQDIGESIGDFLTKNNPVSTGVNAAGGSRVCVKNPNVSGGIECTYK